ncbi:MAG TPA: MFS transporter, partial [Myxococcales bacterium]|nr:MFS transporter [Myxococcales bacterium]
KLLAASSDPEHLAEAYAFHRGMDHFGAAIGPLVASALLFAWPERFRLVFALAALPGALAVAVLFAVRERPARARAPSADISPKILAEAELSPPGAVRPDARARIPSRLLLSIFVFTLGNSTDALLLLRAQGLGVPTVLLPVAWTLLHVVRAGTSWPLGRLGDLVGRQRALAAGWAWYALCYFGFAVAKVPWHAWVLFAAYGLVAGLTEGSERALVASSVPQDRRGRALGVYNLVSGAGLLAASVVAGELWDHVSPATALATGAALAIVAAVLLQTQPSAPPPA